MYVYSSIRRECNDLCHIYKCYKYNITTTVVAAAPDDIHLLIKYSNTLPFQDLYILQFFLKQHHNVLFILFNATQHTFSSIQT